MAPLPKNWPPTIPYLTTPKYSPTLTSAQLTVLRTPPSDPNTPIIPSSNKSSSLCPCPLVKILPITSPLHPACGQYGLFAMRDLKPGTFILRYLGEIHGPDPVRSEDGTGKAKGSVRDGSGHENSDYDLSLERELGIGIDADKMGNEARFVNDYRGVRKGGANAEFREIWDGKERGMGVWVCKESKKDKGKGKGIRKGEEIVVSYGRGFWGARRKVEDGADGD